MWCGVCLLKESFGNVVFFLSHAVVKLSGQMEKIVTAPYLP